MRPLFLLALSCSMLGASTIKFLGAPTGVNDGVYYVTPYQISIDGVKQLVTCYDIFDDVNVGDTWQANILTIGQAAASGYFGGNLAGYRRVAWLDAQTYTTPAEEVGLQHAIWDVFGTSPSATAETKRYEAAADAAAANAYAGFDFSPFRFIEQIGGKVGAKGTEQAFVFGLSPSAMTNTPPTGSSATPEPGTLFLLLSGTGCGVFLLRRQRNRILAAASAQPGTR